MKIKLHTLSPVHIGSGEEISPMEYFLNEKFTRINMNRLFDDPEFEPMMNDFIEVAGTQRYIGDQIPEQLLEKHPAYSIPIKDSADEYIMAHQTVVKGFIKSAGRIYIPGSSLKGSILSAILWYVLREAPPDDKREIERLLTTQGKFNDVLNLGFKNMVKDRHDINLGGLRFIHWIDVKDSDLKDPGEVLEISLIKIKGAKTGKEQPILYETLKSGTEFNLILKVKNLKFRENEILNICNQFYTRVLKKDGAANIQTTANLLRLGQGSSAFATSLLILAEDLGINRYDVRPPRTRKRIDEHFAMGWIELQ